jgi:hypothetical protein
VQTFENHKYKKKNIIYEDGWLFSKLCQYYIL